MTDVEGKGGFQQTARVVVRSPERKKESQTDVRGPHSHRLVWKNGKALQLAFDDSNKFSHLDCKACAKNPWSARDGAALTSQYDIQPTGPNLWKVTCKKCGWVFDSG